LSQEPEAGVEAEVDIFVLQPGEAFDARPLGAAGVDFRIAPHGLEARGVGHAGARTA